MTPHEVASRVLTLKRPLLIGLDVDGTLAPIVDDPATAVIPARTLVSLEQLSAADGVTLAFVSGRDCAALQRMAPVANAWHAAEHGAIVLAPHENDVDFPIDESPRAGALRSFAQWAERQAHADVETKPRSVAIHVRKTAAVDPELAGRIIREAAEEAARLQLPTRKGRAVLEVSLMNADKRTAVEEIAQRCGALSLFYAGDDLTDFGAIAFAAEKGVGVFVQSHEQEAPPGASATLDGTGAVAEVLAELAQELR